MASLQLEEIEPVGPQPVGPAPGPAAKTGRSRRGLFLGLGLLVIAGGVVAAGLTGMLRVPFLNGGTATAVAVTATPIATATVALVSATPPAALTAAPAQSVVAVASVPPATPVPTATKLAVAATPAPTAAAPPDPAALAKKAAGLVARGNDAINAGDAPKAIKLFQQAIAVDPKSAKAYLGMGGAYMVAGDNPKAKKAFQRFLDLAPNDPLASQTKQILGTL